MKLRQKISLIIISISYLVSNSVAAVELSLLQKECAEIGFKIKTQENGKCVLQLMDKFNSKATIQSSTKAIKQATTTDDVSAAQQRTNERQLNYEKDAEIAQKKREIEVLERRQNELMDLQRRSVAAQEKAANSGSEAASLLLMQKGLEMMGGGQTRKPTTCMNLGGGIITCN
jgi:hypothetical protein